MAKSITIPDSLYEKLLMKLSQLQAIQKERTNFTDLFEYFVNNIKIK